MAITLDATTLADCEDATANLATNGWTAFGGESITDDLRLERSETYPEREGSYCLEWGCAADANWHGPITPSFTSFDVTTREFGVWFLIPKASNDESQILASQSDALRVRLYDASSNWAEWDIGGNDDFKGGWNFIRVSGNSPDRNSTTAPTYTAITQAAVLCKNAGANNDKQSNGDAYYGVDWFHSFTKITVTGGTAIAPNDLDDIMTAVNTKPFWGQVEKTDIFYNFKCALEIGDGTSTYFAEENKFFLFDPFDQDVPYEIRVKNNADCRFGLKNTGTDGTYAQNGCQLIHNLAGNADIVVESGGILKNYAGRIEGWDTINLGSGGSGLVEMIKVDFYDNVTLELRSTGLDFQDVRMHFPDGSEAAIGTVYNAPDNMVLIKVFQVTDGLAFRVATTVEEYNAGDTTYDLAVLEGVTVDLVNSNFSSSKLKRLAS